MKRDEEENYTLPVLNIPYLSSSRNIKFPREISSYFTANSPYFAAKKKSISRVFFLLFGEISRGFRREKMHFIIAENKKWVIEFKSTVNNLGHMTKMAAMPIYGKNPSKIFSETNRLISIKGIDSETHIWPCTYSFRCYSTCYKSNSTDLPHNKYTIIV